MDGTSAIYFLATGDKAELYYKGWDSNTLSHTPQVKITDNGTVLGAGNPNTIRQGTANPSDALGIDGDSFVNSVSGDLFLKVSGAYGTATGNLRGPIGVTGNDGLDGNDGVDGSNGSNGNDGLDGNDGADGEGVAVGGTTGQVLSKVDGTNFNTTWVDPASGTGDLVSTNNLSDVNNAVTSLANLGGLSTSHTSGHAPSDAQKNSDITKAEIEAKLTGEISSHTHAGGGGSGAGEEVVVQLGAGASIANKVSSAPSGGIPAGITVVPGNDPSVDASLGSLSVDDLVIIHNKAKVSISVQAVGEATFPTVSFNQVFPSGSDSGFGASTMKTSSNGNQTAVVGFNISIGANRSWTKINLFDILT